MRFTLKQLEYFVAAGEAGSITGASERVHISQPSISSAISLVEAEFGVQLFIRHHAQGLSLTPQGQRLLREAKLLLAQAAELEAAAGELSTQVGGMLPIGCLVTLYPLLVPELIQVFRARYRGASVHAIAGDQVALLNQLRRGDIALALTYDLDIPPDIDLLPLATLPPVALVGARHRLARRRTIALAELADEPFLLLDLPMSREYFLSLFHKLGLEPKIAGRFEHLEVLRSMVARGEGFSLVNARPRNRASLDGRKLAYLGLDAGLRPLQHGAAVMRGVRRTKTAEAFLDLCREVTRDDRLPGTD